MRTSVCSLQNGWLFWYSSPIWSFFLFSFPFRMTPPCLAWFQRSAACRGSYYHTHELNHLCDSSPACPTPILSTAAVPPSLPPSLPRWRHRILRPTALAPLALSHRSAAGLTGSDIWQRLPFSSWAQEAKNHHWERLLPSKTGAFHRKRALWEKNVNMRRNNSKVGKPGFCPATTPSTPPSPPDGNASEEVNFSQLQSMFLFYNQAAPLFSDPTSSSCQAHLLKALVDTGNIPLTALLHVLHAAHQRERTPCF